MFTLTGEAERPLGQPYRWSWGSGAIESVYASGGADMTGGSNRTEVCAVRLNKRQVAYMDQQRGNLSRSAWIRMLILAEEQGRRPTPLR